MNVKFGEYECKNKQKNFVWLAAALAQVRLSMRSSHLAVENYDRSPDGDYRRGEIACENNETDNKMYL